jgi:hypothetical protein
MRVWGVLVGLALATGPAFAQNAPAMERYTGCRAAEAAGNSRIVDLCDVVDDTNAQLARASVAHQRGIAAMYHVLSTALLAIGVEGDDLALEDAISAARVVAAYYDRPRTRVRWAGAQLHIAAALNARAAHGAASYAREAADVARAGIAETPRAQQPELFASLNMALAHALMRIGGEGDRGSLLDAAAALRTALGVYRAPRFADERQRAEAELAWVLRALGETSGT